MSGQQDPTPQLPPTEVQSNNSPPSTPPDSILNDSDQKQSRKREREVSLEPANTPKASDIDAPTFTDFRDARTPAKRNRRTLESTKEEAEDGVGKASSRSRSRSHSVSPPIGVGVSPRQEIKIKVRQISQGVEELTWKTPKVFDNEQQDAEIVTPSILAPPAEVDENASAAQDIVITEVKDGDSQRLAQQEAADNDKSTRAEVSADNGAASATVAPALQAHVRSISEGGEKGLKRRFAERGTSQGPNEGESSSKYTSEPLKRPRDEGEDPNPRETKRPSPPPETKKTSPKLSPPSPKVAAPKLTGFMAYASVSPFAAAKGPSIFSSGKNTPTSIFVSSASSTPLSSFASSSGGVSPSLSKNLKHSGFEAFASSPSPFSSIARSKSPILGQTSKITRARSPPARSHFANSNPFASYIGNSQGFIVPAQKRVRADSPAEPSQNSLGRNSSLDVLEPNGSQTPEEVEEEVEEEEKATSFGERLRSTRDEDEDSNKSEDDAKISLTEQEVITGEEEDYTIHQVRCKLFSLENGQWKERGTGMMRLNVRQLDGTGARLVMRKEAVYTLLINVTLFHGMLCTLAPQDPRYIRFSAIENGITTHYNLRLGSAKAAQDLLNKVLSHIPSA